MIISLQTESTGHYLAAEENGGGAVNANRDEAHAWERFQVVRNGPAFHLVTEAGYVLRANEQLNRLEAQQQCLSAGTLFAYAGLDQKAIRIYATDRYLSARDGGGSHVEVDRTEIGPWERWRVHDWAIGQPPARQTTPPPSTGTGLDIPESELTGGFLYNKPFFLPGRLLAQSDAELSQSIQSLQGLGNIAVSTVNWHGADEFTTRWHGLEDQPRRTTKVLDRLNTAGLANIVFLMGQEYFTQHLGWDFNKLYDQMERSARLVAPYAKWIIAMWEGAETLGGSYNQERRLMLEAIRRGAGPDIRIGRHERPREGVYVEDIQNLGDVVCCLQTGFDADDGAIRRFLREDLARMRGYAAMESSPGRFEAGRFMQPDRQTPATCLVGAFEHSLPDVSPRWPTNQTWAEAQHRGQVCLDAGAAFDMSGGQVR